jgi:hypothetical protein
MLYYVKGDKRIATRYTVCTDHVILFWQLSQERRQAEHVAHTGDNSYSGGLLHYFMNLHLFGRLCCVEYCELSIASLRLKMGFHARGLRKPPFVRIDGNILLRNITLHLPKGIINRK